MKYLNPQHGFNRLMIVSWDRDCEVRCPRGADPNHTLTPAAISCAPKAGTVTVVPIEKAIGHKAETQQGVVNVNIAREGSMDGVKIGGSMGLTTWAAFSGSDDLTAC